MKKIFVIFVLFIFSSNVYAVDTYSDNMVLYNLNDNIIVDELNKDEKVSIASMTKIMTTLVAIENIDNLDEKIKLTYDVFEGLKEENASVAGFFVGEVVTYRDLLYGALLPSGADATRALAINIAGSEYNFVKLMNNKAKELNLMNTHFVNTTGLDEDNHYSTVNDVALLLMTAYKNETFKEIFLTKKYVTSDNKITMSSTLNRTLNAYNISADYIIGGKTGYTTDAGRCLASIAYDDKNDLYYLLVTAKAPITTSYYHLLDAKNIYDYYINNYGYQNLVEVDDIVVTLKTKYAKEKTIDIKANKNVFKYLDNDFNKDKITLEYEGVNEVKYNIKPNTKIGIVKVLYNNELVDTIDVFISQKLHFSILIFVKENIVIILSIILLIICTICSINKKKKKKRR